jgi:hypothetical protein
MTPSAVVVEKVRGLRGRLAFHRVAAALRTEPQFTPDIVIDFLRQTSPRNPFFRHAEAEFYVAKRDGKAVGRVAACYDRAANAHHGENIILFGFFETVDAGKGGAEVTRALLDACTAMGRRCGARALRGPIDLSMNHKVGLLVDDDSRPPTVMMPWNPIGHAALLESYGLSKVKDVVAMEVDRQTIQIDRYAKIAERALERRGFVLRGLDLKNLPGEMATVRRLFNGAWADNWGYTPVDEEEFNYLAKGLKDVLNPRLGMFIEKDGRAVAFSLSIPDVALAIREIHGRLLPFGWLHFLRRLKTIHHCRVALLGVDPEFRRSGADAILYFETARRGMDAGYDSAEFGWLLEDNYNIIRGCEASGAKITKRFRIYEKSI